MRRYVAWLRTLPGKTVFVGYPAAYDFLFVYWYLIRFAGESPFTHQALDVKSYAMALLRRPYTESHKKNFPERWFDPFPAHARRAGRRARAGSALLQHAPREPRAGRLTPAQPSRSRKSSHSCSLHHSRSRPSHEVP